MQFSFYTGLVFTLFCGVSLFTGCTGCVQQVGADRIQSVMAASERNAGVTKNIGNEKLRIADWNTETFFDCNKDGTEYDEFKKSSAWGKEPYIERLKRLCLVIKAVDADVFVMEEIENEAVMHDISNFLAGEWDFKKVYAYGCFARDEGSAIGCGVISRFPLSEMTVHSLDVRSEGESMPLMRPLIQVTVSKNGRPLVLLVNHWKSKSGGTQQTEKWRNWQEHTLARMVMVCKESGRAVVACGDFNRDIADFANDAAAGTVSLSTGCGGVAVTMETPWYQDGTLTEPGSYLFNGDWERIDHFFIAGNAQCLLFAVETDGPWCEKETSIPLKYEVWSGYGYSDHLPISCTIQF